MTTTQIKVLINLVKFKVEQNYLGKYDLTYKLSTEERQNMVECRIDGLVPAECIGIKLV